MTCVDPEGGFKGHEVASILEAAFPSQLCVKQSIPSSLQQSGLSSFNRWTLGEMESAAPQLFFVIGFILK